MNSKSLLMAVAAFAVTTTGVHAYNGTDILEDAGLTEAQIEAVQEAHELRQAGDREAARDLLMDAGISAETMQSIRKAIREHRHEHRESVRSAIESNDYDAFMEAVDGLPLADIITSEDDFTQLVEAHELRRAGDREAAREIMDELGFEPNHGKHDRSPLKRVLSKLTDEQREALREAHENGDREAVRAVFDEAGVPFPGHDGSKGRGNR